MEVLDLNSSVNLFPRLFPLSLYYQRVESKNETNVLDKNTRSTYGLNWIFPLRNLPTFRLNMQQSDLDSGTASDSTTRYINLSADGRYRGLNLRTGAQYTEVEVEGSTSHDSYSLNVNMDGPINLSETMTMNAFATYANRGGTPVGGVGNFQERGAGLSLFHRPSLRFNWNASYSFYDTPANVKFQRHILTGALNWRPSGNFDFGANTRFLRFQIDQVEINSVFLNGHGSWRPFFGLNISQTLSGGITDTKGGGSQSDIIYFRPTLVVSYFQSFLELVRWTSTVTSGPGLNWTDSGSATRNWDFPLNFSTTWDNLDTRYVYVALTYLYSYLRAGEDDIVTTNRRDHRVQLSANTRYFRNLLTRGDNLVFEFLTNYTIRTAGEPEEQKYLTDLQATYYLARGFSFRNGYIHQDSSGNQEVSDSVFGEVRWNTVVFRSVSVVSSARQTWQFNKFAGDQETLTGNANLGYQIGRLSLNVQYAVSRSKYETKEYWSHSVQFSAVRPF